ncbi:MAG: type IV pili methyl-accepting chemotaxis transducer N-terminal domain-containing protein [Paracoccaceae bacterium]|nr:type IV pili methyl-accepting chemotaxis transducer N-terminal domain-containing protein [Paracoccaceae bacterium]
MTNIAFLLTRAVRTVTLCLILTTLALPTAATERSATEVLALKIDMAGRQRMLSQRLVASACFLSLGIQPETQELALTESIEIYRTTLDRLELGNMPLGLPAATDPQTLWALRSARTVWAQVAPLAEAVLAGDSSPETLQALARHEPALLSASQAVVNTLTTGLDIPPEQAARNRTIDMAGRQRMPSQAIIKEACLLSRADAIGLDTSAHHTAITARTDLFELSMSMLRVGDDEAGIAPPPDANTEDAMDTVLLNWTDMRTLVDPALEGRAMDLNALEDLAVSYEALLQQLEDIVWMTANG